MNLLKFNRIHFIGIGGIGVSALANYFISLGKKVSGSDLASSEIIKKLKKKKATVYIGKHKKSNLPKGTDLIIYSKAIKAKNPELVQAKKNNLICLDYSQALSFLMLRYIPLVVSGTHGKSTTTAMLGQIFIEAGLDPTIILGTLSQNLGGNCHVGLGRFFIVEGDEYRESFINYSPVGLIVNNIEADHLDYYSGIDEIIGSFSKLIKKVPAGGCIVANADDKNVLRALKTSRANLITFGFYSGDFRIIDIVQFGELTRIFVKGPEDFDLSLRVPGRHNTLNALAAVLLANYFGISFSVSKRALLKFTGSWRRFEIVKSNSETILIDDYAHHPTEIKTTIQTAKFAFPNKKNICIFQPHSSNRTKNLLKEFSLSFEGCDHLIITDVYKVFGREGKKMFDAKKLAEKIRLPGGKVEFIRNFSEIPKKFRKNQIKDKVIIIMGAGDITKLRNEIAKKIK